MCVVAASHCSVAPLVEVRKYSSSVRAYPGILGQTHKRVDLNLTVAFVPGLRKNASMNG